MIRLCTMNDKMTWVNFNKAFMNYEYEDEKAGENPLYFGNLEKDFEEIQSHSSLGALLFLVEEEGQAVGFMNIQQFFSVWCHGEVCLLDDFFIQERDMEKRL